MGDPRSFHYLNQTNCYEVANVDDAREYIETRNAMDIVGIDQEEQVQYILEDDLQEIADKPRTNSSFLAAQGCNLQSSSGNPSPWKHRLLQRA